MWPSFVRTCGRVYPVLQQTYAMESLYEATGSILLDWSTVNKSHNKPYTQKVLTDKCQGISWIWIHLTTDVCAIQNHTRSWRTARSNLLPMARRRNVLRHYDSNNLISKILQVGKLPTASESSNICKETIAWSQHCLKVYKCSALQFLGLQSNLKPLKLLDKNERNYKYIQILSHFIFTILIDF